MTDAKFVELANQILEFLTPKQLADDLKVKPARIEAWSLGERLPTNHKDLYYKQMAEHTVWDNL